MENKESYARNADLILTELRQKGISPKLKRQINRTNFKTIFIFNLSIAGYIGIAFIQVIINPVLSLKPQINGFQQNIPATIIFIGIMVIAVSAMLAFITVKISSEIINSNGIESESQLGEIESRVSLGNNFLTTANKYSIEIAEAYVKSKIDWMNDKISFLTTITVISAFLTGTLPFLEFNDTGSKLIGSCTIWMIFIIRLVFSQHCIDGSAVSLVLEDNPCNCRSGRYRSLF